MNKLFLVAALCLTGCGGVITDADLANAAKYCKDSGVASINKSSDPVFWSFIVKCKDGSTYTAS